jgi:hypothetical protein
MTPAAHPAQAQKTQRLIEPALTTEERMRGALAPSPATKDEIRLRKLSAQRQRAATQVRTRRGMLAQFMLQPLTLARRRKRRSKRRRCSPTPATWLQSWRRRRRR